MSGPGAPALLSACALRGPVLPCLSLLREPVLPCLCPAGTRPAVSVLWAVGGECARAGPTPPADSRSPPPAVTHHACLPASPLPAHPQRHLRARLRGRPPHRPLPPGRLRRARLLGGEPALLRRGCGGAGAGPVLHARGMWRACHAALDPSWAPALIPCPTVAPPAPPLLPQCVINPATQQVTQECEKCLPGFDNVDGACVKPGPKPYPPHPKPYPPHPTPTNRCQRRLPGCVRCNKLASRCLAWSVAPGPACSFEGCVQLAVVSACPLPAVDCTRAVADPPNAPRPLPPFSHAVRRACASSRGAASSPSARPSAAARATAWSRAASASGSRRCTSLPSTAGRATASSRAAGGSRFRNQLNFFGSGKWEELPCMLPRPCWARLPPRPPHDPTSARPAACAWPSAAERCLERPLGAPRLGP